MTSWEESLKELEKSMLPGAELLTILETHSNGNQREWPKITLQQLRQVILGERG